MRLAAVYAFVVREVVTAFRDRATLFWVFAWPVIWILMTAYVFVPVGAGKPVTLNLGVVVEDTGGGGFNVTLLLRILNETSYRGTPLFRVTVYDNVGGLWEAVREGDVDAGLVVPRGFARNITLGQARLIVLIGGGNPYRSSIAYATLSAFLSRLSQRIALEKVRIALTYIERYYNWSAWQQTPFNVSPTEFIRLYLIGIAAPLNTSFVEVKPEAVADRASLLGWWTLGAIGMMMLYTGFNAGVGMVVWDRERMRLHRILSTPVTEAELLVGRLLGSLIVVGLSAAIGLVVGYAVGARVAMDPTNLGHWIALGMLIVAALLSVGMGIPLSLVATTPRGASGLATALGLMLAFTAGIWFPREWMPEPLQLLATAFPVTWALDTVRALLVYGKSVESQLPSIVGSLTVLAALYAIDVLLYRKLIRKYVELS